MAEAGNAQRLEGFTYLGQPLPSPAETYEACQSELEKTSFVLLQILSSGYNVALEITDKYKVDQAGSSQSVRKLTCFDMIGCAPTSSSTSAQRGW